MWTAATSETTCRTQCLESCIIALGALMSETWEIPINFANYKHIRIGHESTVTSNNFDADDLLLVDTEIFLRSVIFSSLKTSTQTVEACLSTRSMPGANRRSLDTLSTSAFSKFYVLMFVRGWNMVDLQFSRAPPRKC